MAIIDAIVTPVPDARAEPATSGTRLKARYLVGTDGSKQWNYGWYDSTRGENCFFSAASDRTTRCMPSVGAYATGTSYGDSGCTQEIVSVATGACGTVAPKYVSRLNAACGAYVGLYQIGSSFSGTNYYLKSGTSCISVATAAGASFAYIGAEVPPSSFVAATEQTDP